MPQQHTFIHQVLLQGQAQSDVKGGHCKFGEPLSPGISQKELYFFGLSGGEVKS